jgi:uncharacterized protein (TIGR02246 family)
MEQTAAFPERAARVDSGLESTLQRFTQAFNRQVPEEVASFWAEEGTLLNPVGELGTGRGGVERVYRKDTETILKGTSSKFTIRAMRQIGSDTAFLDLDHDIAGFRMADGSMGHVQLHLVILARRKDGAWHWLDARPYAFMPPPERKH